MIKFYKFLTTLVLCFWVLATHAQTTVSGVVTDAASGEGLAGVNIVIKGTATGVITDVNGSYTINVPDANTNLVFSFVGYLTKEMQVGPASQLDIQLDSDLLNLEEVVVTGLATSVKRTNLGNAVSTVSSKELMGTTQPQTLDQALYGKLTGANINANSGAPGGGISVKLRGITTINGTSEPLYIIDGVYIDNSAISIGTNLATNARTNGSVSDEQDNPANRIADLNPDDIENIEILKGASAAAIYGARANAGVIIITTKRGKTGETKVNFSQDFGVSSILNPLGSRDWDESKVEAQFTSASDPTAGPAARDAFVAARNSGSLLDYEDLIYGSNGFITNSRISVTGGNDKTKFFFSGSWKDEEGIISGTGFERKDVRVNLDHKVSNLIDFGVSTNYIRSQADRAVTNNDNSGVSLGIALVNTYPWIDLRRDADGNYPNNPTNSSNPLQTRDLSTIREQTNRFIGGGTVNVNLIQNNNAFLKIVLRGGIDYFNTEGLVHFPEVLQWQQAGATASNGFFNRGDNTFFNTNSSAFAVFNTNAGDINLTSQVGVNRLTFSQERLTTVATQLIGGTRNLEQASSINVFNRQLDNEDIGYVVQQEANWDDKLIATFGVRWDKSSLNGDPDELFGYPKASLAANLPNLGIIGNNFFDQFKVRVAYGEAGGVPTADRVDLQQPAFTVFAGENVGGNAGSLIGLTRGNSQIRPERSKEFETGVDLAIFNRTVSIEATYYNKLVEDLILVQQVPQSTGFDTRIINGGELRNEGLELSLGVTPVNTSQITVNSRFNFWLNRSKVERLAVPEFDAPNGGFASFLGIARISEGSSASRYVGPLPGSDGDVTIGDAEPDFQLSWYSNVTFLNNFELGMLWHWKKGGDIINLTSLLADFAGTTHDFDNDRDGDGTVNGVQRINAFINRNDAGAFVEDGGYIKLREISLKYTVPSSITEAFLNGAFERIRVGVSGNNLILISDYSSYDPEVSNFGGNGVATGIEVAPFPSSKRVFFHLSFDF